MKVSRGKVRDRSYERRDEKRPITTPAAAATTAASATAQLFQHSPNLIRHPLARALEAAVERQPQAQLAHWQDGSALTQRAAAEIEGGVMAGVLLIIRHNVEKISVNVRVVLLQQLLLAAVGVICD